MLLWSLLWYLTPYVAVSAEDFAVVVASAVVVVVAVVVFVIVVVAAVIVAVVAVDAFRSQR